MSELSREQIEEFRRDQLIHGPSPLHEAWLAQEPRSQESANRHGCGK
jgi:hypothetical protein